MPVNRGFTGKIVQTVTGAAAGVAGTEYVVGTTGVSTGSGVLFIGVNTDTARPAKVASDGTLFITGTISGGGGGIQYVQDTTSQAATASGTLFLGINATTVRGFKLSATGVPGVSQDGVWTVTVSTGVISVSTVSGVVVISGTVDGTFGGQTYTINTTGIAATGTGFLMIGIQSGATTARGFMFTTSGAGHVFLDNNPVISGTVTAIPSNTGTLSNVLTVGTLLGTVTVTAANVTIASVTTGTMNVVNVLSATGVLLGATTANVGAYVLTAHASNWSAAAISTTSGGGHAILKTSGAHTLYVTDLFVSVNVPMNVSIYSSSAAQDAKLVAYLATKGGFAINLKSPLVLTSAQSLVFIGDASGSCSAFAAGYTVT